MWQEGRATHLGPERPTWGLSDPRRGWATHAEGERPTQRLRDPRINRGPKFCFERLVLFGIAPSAFKQVSINCLMFLNALVASLVVSNISNGGFKPHSHSMIVFKVLKWKWVVVWVCLLSYINDTSSLAIYYQNHVFLMPIIPLWSLLLLIPCSKLLFHGDYD